MKFIVKTGLFEKQSADCLIIALFADNKLSDLAKKIDKQCQGYLSKLLKKQKDFKGKPGQTQLLYHLPNVSSSRVLLVGCGDANLLARDYRKIITASIKAITTANVSSIINGLVEIKVENHTTAWKIKQAIETTNDVLYRFDQFKSEKEPKAALSEMIFWLPDNKQLAACNKAVQQGMAVACGVTYAKDLANLPSNVCTPIYLADSAKKLAKKYKRIAVSTLNKKQIKKLGMGAFYAVAQGSTQDAQLITLNYRGADKKQRPVVLVGKGITFDTGGINLKSLDGMIGMKYDMCGAASILGTMKAIAELKLPINVVGLLACAENMPDGGAIKTEDIVTTLSGLTVEIMSTDAEGRLVLGDTLTYAERFKPAFVIDIATLTYAVIAALGHHVSAVVSNNEPLTTALIKAGIESHDRIWQLPLLPEYQEQIRSPFADISNSGGKSGAGVITAGCFLSRFAKQYKWAHLDVAGTAAGIVNGDRAATGRPVPLLVQYLIDLCA